MIDWKQDCRDTMWAMFWIAENVDPEIVESDKESLKENVARLIRMTTQKTVGQRGTKGHIDWNCLEHLMLAIVCGATKLCLSGEFGEMPEMIEE